MLKHIAHHGKKLVHHIKHHHRKYLFSLIWGGLFVKLAMFILTGMGVILPLILHADVQTGCQREGEYQTGGYLTGSHYTGEYLTGEYLTGGELIEGYHTGGYYTGEYITGCYMTGEYLTGGYFSGEVWTGEYLTGAYETGCYLTGEYFTGEYYVDEYMTGQYYTGVELTGGYRTGEYMTGSYLTGGYRAGCITLSCEPADLDMVSPVAGNSVGGVFDIQRSYLNTDCSLLGNIKQFTVQLQDHNDQWIDLGTIESTGESVAFDSNLLKGVYDASGVLLSGLYTVTGTNTSGQVYNVFTGLYEGLYTNYATGYQIKITDQSGTVFYLGDNDSFTIDNKKPSISGITVMLNGVRNAYIGLSGTAKVSFLADEELSGNTVTIRGEPASLDSVTGLQYTYLQTLSTQNTEGELAFTIDYRDVAGNTGVYTSTGPIMFDKTEPTISGFTLSGDDMQGFTLSWETSEDTTYTLEYTISGASGQVVSGAAYATSFNYLITGINIGNSADFVLDVEDKIGNVTSLTGNISISNDGVVDFEYHIIGSTMATVTAVTEQVYNGITGSIATFAITLQNEINKFNECKNSVPYKTLKLKVQRKDFMLNMPRFGKDSVQTIVNSFVIFMIEKLKDNRDITDEDINLVTRKFNNLLVILKLVRDDENECRQSLSNYHILQFQRTMKEFNIEL